MGFHGFSLGSLLLVLLITVLVFGTKRLRNVGEDLGAAVRGFRQGLQGETNKVLEENKKHDE